MLAPAVDTIEPDDAPQPSSKRPSVMERPMPGDGLLGWAGPLAITVLAGLLRLWHVTRPRGPVFDEVYYPKDAHDLLRFGVERGDSCVGPGFVVHPPLGKWLIALSEQAFGYVDCNGQRHGDPELGWRFASVVAGTLAVLILARAARRMFRSTALGCLAGLLLALDGMELVQSRTGILDIFLMFWIVVAIACLALDRDWTRSRLAAWGRLPYVLRPWQLACGASLGAALSTKLSGGYTVPALAGLALAWTIGARRSADQQRPSLAFLRRDALGWVLAFLIVPVAVYTASWTGWFVTDTGFDRGSHSGVLGALQSWLDYHSQIRTFHEGLSSHHPYQSDNPFQWLILGRPVDFSYLTPKGAACPYRSGCSAQVLDQGNPIIWWPGALAVLACGWRWVTTRDWRAALVLAGFVLSFAPWLAFPGRTKFQFYALPLLPFIVLAITLVAGWVVGSASSTDRRRTVGSLLVGSYAMAVLVAFAYFYPIWTGQTISYSAWYARMWFPSWI